MLEQQTIKLTHATWTQDDGSPVEVFIYPEHIFAVLYMPSLKATAVQAASGAYMSVSESVEEVNNIVAKLRQNNAK